MAALFGILFILSLQKLSILDAVNKANIILNPLVFRMKADAVKKISPSSKNLIWFPKKWLAVETEVGICKSDFRV